LLQSALSVHPAEEPNTAEEQGLREYALWLEDAALDRLSELDREIESALNLSATINEFVGSLGPFNNANSIFHPPLADLLRSAILASLTSYKAQSCLTGRRVRARLDQWQPASRLDRLHRAVSLTVADLLGRDYQASFTMSTQLRALASAAVLELGEHDATGLEYVELDLAAAIGIAAGTAAVGMLVGDMAVVLKARELFSQTADKARRDGDNQWHWLGERLRAVTSTMHASSTHRVLKEHGIPDEFIRVLERDGVFELWKPQLDAIHAGLLDPTDPPHLVVTLPPGAGKTLIAELAIVSGLQRDPSTFAMYIAPSRALVNQVSVDLRDRLRACGIQVHTILAGAEQSTLLGAELELLSQHGAVTVTTPEKLDAYYRNAQSIFDNSSVIIFDEVHKIEDSTRGATIESLITRLISLQPKIRLVLLSGVLSNHDELLEWLGRERTRVVVAQRRPTRQVRGVAVAHAIERGAPRPAKNGLLRRVRFSGGLSMVHENQDIDYGVVVQIPSIFSGFYNERLYGRVWRRDASAAHSTTNDHAVTIAERLAISPGTTLVFVQTPDFAESCCRRFRGHIPTMHARGRDLLSKFVASELGRQHELVGLCGRGIAFHHAKLPTSVQRAVELGLERGWVQVVFATPTLREGLNTPVTNVVLAGYSYWDSGKEERAHIRETDFENLAGRAGRPLREPEGRVILVPDSMAQASVVTAAKKYLLVGEEALRVRSQFSELGEWINRSDDIFRMPEDHQSTLLGLVAAGLDGEDSLRGFFQQTLWAVQDSDGDKTRDISTRCAKVIAAARESAGPDRVAVASRTGLSLTSVRLLFERLSPETNVFQTPSSFDERDPVDVVVPLLLNASLELKEIRKGSLAKDGPPGMHLLPIKHWLRGSQYQVILGSAIETGALPRSADLGDAVRYCSDVSVWLSWSFGACLTVLESLVSDIDSWVGSSPLLVRYGVTTRLAAYMCLLGVADRSTAQTLADFCRLSIRDESFSEVQRWISESETIIDDIFPENDLRNELFRSQMFKQRSRVPPYLLVEARYFTVTETGGVQQLAIDQGALVIRDRKGRLVGEVVQPQSVFDFCHGSLDAAVGVALPNGGNGAAGSQMAIFRIA